MPDLTHNDADSSADGFHEIQLSGKQLVFLFMATTVVAVFIFLCGVLVGRNIRNDRATDSADAMAMASSTAAPAAQPSSQTTAPAAEPPPPAEDADDGLSYPKRLQATNAPPERLKPPSAAPALKTPSSAAPAAAASNHSPSVAAPKTPPAPPVSAPKTAASTGAPLPGAWIVQVQALKDRGAADAIARHLVSKGYPAFVLDPDSGAPAIYRVQVGRYSDRQEAEQIARRLEKDEQFKPIIHSAR
ncbi:MAG: SPOR domain-containing protein [Vicinamibacterales bacterium]